VPDGDQDGTRGGDTTEARLRAAAAGHAPAAQYELAVFLLDRGHTGESDIAEWAEAWALLERASATVPAAATMIGHLSEDRGDRAGAERWFRRAAEAGDTEAAVALGALLMGTWRLAEAERWLRTAGPGHAVAREHLERVVELRRTTRHRG
jgi:TPR repeat protein